MRRILLVMIFMLAGCTPAEQSKTTTCPAGYVMLAGKCVERA